MADGPASTIVFDGDSTGAVAALHAVDVEAKRAAASVKGAGAALGGIGNEADVGVEKAVAATKRFESQLKRLNLELESGGRNTAAYIEGRAKLAGADTAALAPLIAQYDQLKAKQSLANAEFTKAGKVMGDYGMTAKATTAALRQVPAQFTDIIVSLQGGQAPLTVLLQQGGQLKDVFGGAGNAIRALGGYVASLVNPFSLAAAAVGVLGVGYYKGSQEADAFRLALVTTGNQVGTTTGALAGMAENISAVSGTTGAAAAALAQFAASGAVGAAGLEKFTAAALDFEKFTGTAVAETVKQFKALGDEPLKASLKLNESTNFLTTSLYEQIKALTEQGRTIEAANLAQNAFADTISGRANEMKANLGLVESAWLAIKSAVFGAGDAIASIGRKETVGQQIAKIQTELAAYSKGGTTTFEDLRTKQLREQLDVLNRIALKEQNRATDAAQQKFEVENLLAADKALEPLGVKKLKLADALLANRRALVLAGKDEKVIAEAELAIRKKYEEKGPKASDGDSARLKEQTERMKINRQLAVQMGDEVTKANDAYQKALADSTKENQKYVDSLDKSADAVAAQVLKLQDEEQALRISQEQHISLAEAVSQVEIARLREKQAIELSFGNDAAAQAIQREIDARKQLATFIDSKDAREASGKAAKEAESDWKKAAEKINDSITDALLRGFESGKGFAENLRDTVTNMFKTMVLRPTVSAIVGGLTGFGSAAQAADSPVGSAIGSFASSALGSASSAIGSITLGGASVSAISSSVLMGLEAGYTGAAISGGSAAFTAGSAVGGGAAAIQAGLASIGPAGWAIIAAAAAIAVFNNKQWETKYGGSFDNSGADGAVNKLYGPGTGGEFANQFAQTALKATENSINAVFAKIGSASRVGYFSAGAESSSEGEAYAYAGGRLTSGQSFGQIGSEFNRGGATAEEATANYVRELQQSTLQALQAATDIPKSVSDKLAGIDINALTGDALTKLTTDIDTFINAVVGVQASLSATPFANIQALSFDATAGLIAFSGGLEKLQAGLASYYDNFFSAEEKRKQTLQEIATALNAAGADTTAEQLSTTTRAQFRAVAEGIDVTTESGQKLYAAMIAVSGAFASAVPAAAASAAAVSKISDAMQSLAEDTANLQIELLAAQGNAQGAAEALRALETQGFGAAEIAAYDMNTGLRKTIDTLYAVTEAANAASASQTDLAAKYANPLTVQSASALLPAGNAEALLAMGPKQIRDTIADYINALDPLTETGREAIAHIEGLSSALDVLIGEVDRVAAQDAADTLKAAADAQAAYTRAVEAATQRISAAQSAVNSANSAVDAVRAEGTNSYLTALQAVAAAQDRVTSIQLDAQVAIANAANAAAKEMQGLAAQLREFVDGAGLTPSANFGKILTAALGGDKDAMRALPGAANSAIDGAKTNATSGADFALERARILGRVSAAATAAEIAGRNTVTAPTALDTLAKAQQELVAAQVTLAQSLSVANAIGAPLTASVTDLIAKFSAAQAESLKAQNELLNAQFALATIGTNTGSAAASLATLRDDVATTLVGKFEALDTSLDGLLSFEEFKTGFTGLASESSLQNIFDEIDLNGDGVIEKLEAIRVSAAATATSTASFATGANAVVSFSADDPIRSVFENISKTNALLVDSQQLALVQLLGVDIAENLGRLGEQDSLFIGTYTLQSRATTAMENVATLLAAAINGTAAMNVKNLTASSTVAMSTAPTVNSVTASTTPTATAPVVVPTAPVVVAPTPRSYEERAAAYVDNYPEALLATWATGATGYSSKSAFGAAHWETWGQQQGFVFPAFAQGTNYLPNDTFAMLHEGEAVVPKAYNPFNPNAKTNDSELVGEIRSLRADNAAQARAMVQMQQRMTKLMERWDSAGIPEERVTA